MVTEIDLPEDRLAALGRLSVERKKSMADLIREAE